MQHYTYVCAVLFVLKEATPQRRRFTSSISSTPFSQSTRVSTSAKPDQLDAMESDLIKSIHAQNWAKVIQLSKGLVTF